MTLDERREAVRLLYGVSGAFQMAEALRVTPGSVLRWMRGMPERRKVPLDEQVIPLLKRRIGEIERLLLGDDVVNALLRFAEDSAREDVELLKKARIEEASFIRHAEREP